MIFILNFLPLGGGGSSLALNDVHTGKNSKICICNLMDKDHFFSKHKKVVYCGLTVCTVSSIQQVTSAMLGAYQSQLCSHIFRILLKAPFSLILQTWSNFSS